MYKDQLAGPETQLARWHRAHKELRALERQLVELSKITEEPAQLDSLYLAIERLRAVTTTLFEAAQLNSLHNQFMHAPSIGRHLTGPRSLAPMTSLKAQSRGSASL